jgi:hypothetical protein
MSTERWKELCAQAAVEPDPERLLELVAEIVQLLEGQERRLREAKDKPKDDGH